MFLSPILQFDLSCVAFNPLQVFDLDNLEAIHPERILSSNNNDDDDDA